MHYHSFFFRGPGSRHNLKAQNLAVFSQIAEGIDEDTWLFHLRRGDYSRWFRQAVKDNYLAEQAEQIEKRQDIEPAVTRRLIRGVIEALHTSGVNGHSVSGSGCKVTTRPGNCFSGIGSERSDRQSLVSSGDD